jgi:hypothetical protein
MGEVVSFFERKAAAPAQAKPELHVDTASIDGMMKQASALMEKLDLQYADDRDYLSNRDDMGWGARRLDRITRTWHDYPDGSSLEPIAMSWAFYLGQQRLRRLERAIKKGEQLTLQDFRLPNEQIMISNAGWGGSRQLEIAQILHFTDKAIKTYLAGSQPDRPWQPSGPS